MSARLLFLRNFLKNPARNASAVPSSKHAARAILEGLDWDRIDYVVELGPGSGVFTVEICARVKPGTKVLVIELEPSYIASLRNQFSPHIEVAEGSAAQLERLVRDRGWPRIDVILSGLPFHVPDSVKKELHPALLERASRGTVVRCFTYFPAAMKRAYAQFHCQPVKFVIRNVPPMWIFQLTPRN